MNQLDVAYKAVQERNAAEAERDQMHTTCEILKSEKEQKQLCINDLKQQLIENELAYFELSAMCDELAKELAAMCTDDCMQPTTYKDCFISCSVKDVLFKYGAMKSTSGNRLHQKSENED